MIRVACFVQINTLQPLVKMVSLLRIFRVSFRYFRVTRYLNAFWISPECTAPRKTQKQQDFRGLHQCFLLYWISFPWSRWLWSFSFAFYILREFHIRQSGETKRSTILFFVTDNSDICTLSFVLIVLHYYSSLVELCNDLKHGEESVVNHTLKMIRKTDYEILKHFFKFQPKPRYIDFNTVVAKDTWYHCM